MAGGEAFRHSALTDHAGGAAELSLWYVNRLLCTMALQAAATRSRTLCCCRKSSAASCPLCCAGAWHGQNAACHASELTRHRARNVLQRRRDDPAP